MEEKLKIPPDHTLYFRKYLFFPSKIEMDLYLSDPVRLEMLCSQ
jgi:hypothetical protein